MRIKTPIALAAATSTLVLAAGVASATLPAHDEPAPAEAATSCSSRLVSHTASGRRHTLVYYVWCTTGYPLFQTTSSGYRTVTYYS